MQATTEFKLKKETKGTYVYDEVDQIQPKVGTIYVKMKCTPVFGQLA